jgi:hypothetical protein
MRQIAKIKKITPSHIVAKAIICGRLSAEQLYDSIQKEIEKVIEFHQSMYHAPPNFSFEFSEGPKVVMEAGLADLEQTRIIQCSRPFSADGILIKDEAALIYYGNMCDHRLYHLENAPNLLTMV